jgi:hypothetical protein
MTRQIKKGDRVLRRGVWCEVLAIEARPGTAEVWAEVEAPGMFGQPSIRTWLDAADMLSAACRGRGSMGGMGELGGHSEGATWSAVGGQIGVIIPRKLLYGITSS